MRTPGRAAVLPSFWIIVALWIVVIGSTVVALAHLAPTRTSNVVEIAKWPTVRIIERTQPHRSRQSDHQTLGDCGCSSRHARRRKNSQELGGSLFINVTHDLRAEPFRGPEYAV